MLVTAVAVFAGLLAGGILRPESNRFARPKVRWPALLLVGVALLAIGMRTDGDTGLRLVLAGYAVLVIGVASNAHIVGMGVLLVGISANVLVIGMNGGMPVHGESLLRASASADATPTLAPEGHRHLETVDDRLAILDDRIPLPVGGQVLSFGDLIIAVGLADAVAHLTRRRRRDALPAEDVVDLRDPAADDPAPSSPASEGPRRPRHLAGAR